MPRSTISKKFNDELIVELGEPETSRITELRLTKDLQKAAALLGREEARYYVDMYYNFQQLRMGAGSQIRQMQLIGEPSMMLQWTFTLYEQIENDIKSALSIYAKGNIVGRWAMSNPGIGPVIAAGLLAHIDITRSTYAGNLWSFAGLNPKVKWEKGQKRPWNAALKVLSWKIGQSMVKVSNNPNSVYGPLYKQRKVYEQEKNENMEFAEQAKMILATKKIGKETEAYKWYAMGKLPPAHIQARAERWTTKIFLSHYHAVAYEIEYKKPSPEPYALAYLGHQDMIPVPNWPLIEE